MNFFENFVWPFLVSFAVVTVAGLIFMSHEMATPTAILFLSAVVAIKDFK